MNLRRCKFSQARIGIIKTTLKKLQPQDSHRMSMFHAQPRKRNKDENEAKTSEKYIKRRALMQKQEIKDAWKIKYIEALTFGGSSFKEYEEEAFLENFISGDWEPYRDRKKEREKKEPS